MRRLRRFEDMCKDELNRLDERFENGEPLEAITQIGFGKSKL